MHSKFYFQTEEVVFLTYNNYYISSLVKNQKYKCIINKDDQMIILLNYLKKIIIIYHGKIKT